MASQIVPPFGIATIAVPASGKIAAYSTTPYTVDQVVGYPNEPPANQNLFNNSGAYTSSAFTVAGSAVVQAGAQPVLVNVGASASVFERLVNAQSTPGVLNATGALTADMMLTGIVTSTTAAAVAGTVPTGTVMDAAASFAIGDSFDWSVINTGGANAFTVTAASGHSVTGAAAVAASSSGRFRTTKTAAATFVTYRI